MSDHRTRRFQLFRQCMSGVCELCFVASPAVGLVEHFHIRRQRAIANEQRNDEIVSAASTKDHRSVELVLTYFGTDEVRRVYSDGSTAVFDRVPNRLLPRSAHSDFILVDKDHEPSSREHVSEV